MTLALLGYSSTFMRYAMAVTPKNYLLFGCHVVNFGAQATQGYRYVNYHYMGGRDRRMEERAKEGLGSVEEKAKEVADTVKEKAGEMKREAEKVVGR
jgi:mitochondrial pyruvate carrier 1